jgi:hypothetical protein
VDVDVGVMPSGMDRAERRVGLIAQGPMSRGYGVDEVENGVREVARARREGAVTKGEVQ